MFDTEDQSRGTRRGGSLLSVVSEGDAGAGETPDERRQRTEERVRQAREIAASLHRARREAGIADAASPSSEAGPQPAEGMSAAAPKLGIRDRLMALRQRFPRRERPLSDREDSLDPPAEQAAPPARDDTYETPEAEAQNGEQAWRPLVDPVRVVTGIWNSKSLILAMTVLGGLAGVWIALSTPKKYEAVTEIVFDPRNINIVDRELTQQGLPSDATLALVENQVRVMTSVNVLNKVIDRLGLLEDPEFNGRGPRGPLAFISDLRSMLSSSAPGSGNDERALRAITANNLYESLDVVRRGKTFVIAIGATTKDPEKSARIANTVTEEFIKTYGELQAGTAGRATEELTSRLDDLRREVEKAERAVETYKAENDIVNPQGRLITDDEIVRLNEQLTVAKARTIELNARAVTARGVDVDAALVGALPEEVSSSVMTELRAQHASLRQDYDRLAVKLGPRHPQLIQIEAQLGSARQQIRAELTRMVSSIQLELRRAVQLEQDLAARLAQLKARHADVGGELVGLRELERKASTARAVYEAFLLRARETGEQQSLNTANVSVISTAYPPVRPTGASRAAIALAGAMIGFILGLAFGTGLGILDSMRASGVLSPARRGHGARPTGGGNGSRRTGRAVREAGAGDAVAPGAGADAAPVPSLAAHGQAPERARSDGGQSREAEIESTLAELRDSLREFRETMRDLEERRAWRRTS